MTQPTQTEKRPEQSRRRRSSFAAAAAVGAGATLGVFALASDAGAHYVYSDAMAIEQNNWCMSIRSEVSHGSHDAGYYKGDVRMWMNGTIHPYSPCASSRSMPINWLKMQMWQWKAPTSGGGAGVCSSSWVEQNSTSETHYLNITINHGAPTATCGEGWYENETRGWGQRNGIWETASIFSGRHCLRVSAGICQGGGK